LKISHADVTLVLTDDRDIRRFNRKYLHRDRPTDVLAFGADRLPRKRVRPFFLGDIMISVDRAKIHARRFGSALLDELELYIVHGILHLMGFDDRAEKKRVRMRAEEKRVLDQVHAARVRL